METQTLSIIIPVYNEADLIKPMFDRVVNAALPGGLEKQIIIVDDGSTDTTGGQLQVLAEHFPNLTICRHDNNRGKGAAILTALKEVSGDIVLIQDADLEYDPRDYSRLLEPILDGRANVVFGSRFRGETRRVLYFWHYMGNHLVTSMSNMLTNLTLTDMECGYKVFMRETLEQISLREKRFGFEPEVTAKLARVNARIYEVPVSYAGRTYAEGKKINWKDGLSTIRCILRYNLFG